MTSNFRPLTVEEEAKLDDLLELTPEIIEKIKEHNREMKELDRQRVESLEKLGEILDSTLVGIWGQLGTVGVRMYGVFRKNSDSEFHFIVVGKSEEVITASTLEERNSIARTLQDTKWKKIHAYLRGEISESPKDENIKITYEEPRIEINGYVVSRFDPEKTPNGYQVKTIEQFLNSRPV